MSQDTPPRKKPLTALIAADMEGIAGISDWSQCTPDTMRWRQEGCPLMCAEVKAAITGLLEGGFDRVAVVDGHWESTNLNKAAITPDFVREAGQERRVGLIQGDLFKLEHAMVTGAGQADALVIIGAHGATGSGQLMAHTVSPMLSLRLDGREAGETTLNMMAAAALGCPTLLVAGDRFACREARALSADVSLVQTKAVLQGENGRQIKMARPSDVREKLRADLAEMARRFVVDGWRPAMPPVPSPCRMEAMKSGIPWLDLKAENAARGYRILLDRMRGPPVTRQFNGDGALAAAAGGGNDQGDLFSLP